MSLMSRREPLKAVVWAGHDGSNEEVTGEDEDEEEDEDGEEREMDPAKLTVPEIKQRLKELGVRGYSSMKREEAVEKFKEAIAEEEEAEALRVDVEEGDDEGEPNEDDDDEEGMTGEEQELLERLRAAPLIERSELSEGRAFFCWDDERKVS